MTWKQAQHDSARREVTVHFDACRFPERIATAARIHRDAGSFFLERLSVFRHKWQLRPRSRFGCRECGGHKPVQMHPDQLPVA